jgi:hypothetical protein
VLLVVGLLTRPRGRAPRLDDGGGAPHRDARSSSSPGSRRARSAPWTSRPGCSCSSSPGSVLYGPGLLSLDHFLARWLGIRDGEPPPRPAVAQGRLIAAAASAPAREGVVDHPGDAAHQERPRRCRALARGPRPGGPGWR